MLVLSSSQCSLGSQQLQPKKKILYVGHEFAKYDLHFSHSVFLQGPLINIFEFIHLNCSTLHK